MASKNLQEIKDEIGLLEQPFSAVTITAIEAISSFDRRSDAFRYPIDKAGNKFFPEHFGVGIPAIKENLQAIWEDLVGLVDFVDNAYDIAMDIQRMYEEDMSSSY